MSRSPFLALAGLLSLGFFPLAVSAGGGSSSGLTPAPAPQSVTATGAASDHAMASVTGVSVAVGHLWALLAKQRHAQVVGDVHRHDDVVRTAGNRRGGLVLMTGYCW